MAGWPLTQLNGCVGGLLLTHWRHQKSGLPINCDYCTFFGSCLLISLTLFLFLWWASAFFGLDSKPPPTRFLFRAVLDRILSRCHLFSLDLVLLRGSRLLSNVSSPFSLHEKVSMVCISLQSALRARLAFVTSRCHLLVLVIAMRCDRSCGLLAISFRRITHQLECYTHTALCLAGSLVSWVVSYCSRWMFSLLRRLFLLVVNRLFVVGQGNLAA